MSFAIVIFTNEGEVAAVPTSWLNMEEDYCFWPSKSHRHHITRLVKQCVAPDKDGKMYPCRSLGKASTFYK